MRNFLYTKSGIFIAIKDTVVCTQSSNLSNDGQLKEFKLVEGNNSIITSIAISKDENYLFAAYSNKWICCWDIKSSTVCGYRQFKKKSTALVYGELFDTTTNSSHPMLLSADRFGEVYAVDLPMMKKAPVLCMGHTASIITDIILIDNKYLITSDRDEKIRVQSFPNVLDINSYCLGHNGCISCIEKVSDDLILSCSFDHKIILWRYVAGEIAAEYQFQQSNDNPTAILSSSLSSSSSSEVVDHNIVEAADDVVPDDDKGFDDSSAGNYPLKIICLKRNTHHVGDNIIITTVAVIFKGSCVCQVLDIIDDTSSISICHRKSYTLPALPSDVKWLNNNQLLFTLAKPHYIHVLNIDDSVAQSNDPSLVLKARINEYCAQTGVDFVQAVVSSDGDADNDQSVRKHVLDNPFHRDDITGRTSNKRAKHQKATTAAS